MHPILFKLGPLTIYSYGVMVALGFIVALTLAGREAGRSGKIEPAKILDLGFYLLLSGIIGARITYVLLNIKEYLSNPLEIFMLSHGGLIFYGGFVCSILTAAFFLKKWKISFWRAADLLSPYLALGHSIGRIGCFLNGCCYGKDTSLPLGMKFPELSGPVHPTQLYSSLALLFIFLVLRFLQPRFTREGRLFLLYICLYSGFRFLIEFLRGDNPACFFSLTFSQVLSAILFFAALAIFLVKSQSSIRNDKRKR